MKLGKESTAKNAYYNFDHFYTFPAMIDSKLNYLLLIGCLRVTCTKSGLQSLISERQRTLGLSDEAEWAWHINYTYFVSRCMNLSQSLKRLFVSEMYVKGVFQRCYNGQKNLNELDQEFLFASEVIFGCNKCHFTAKNVGFFNSYFWRELLR